LLNRSESERHLTNYTEFHDFWPKPPDPDSVPTGPDPPRVDLFTAQFAAHSDGVMFHFSADLKITPLADKN